MKCEVRERDASSPFSFLRVALALLGPLWLHTNVKIVCFVSMKCHWHVGSGCVYVYIALGSMDVFTIFSPMRTGYLSIDLCLFSFFHQCLSFQCAGLSSPWLNLFQVSWGMKL